MKSNDPWVGGTNYLPTYKNEGRGITGNVRPDTSGMAFAVSQANKNNRFWEHVDVLFKGANKLGATYHEIREKRDIRDTKTEVREAIRQRQIDVFASRTGRAADNVLEDEDVWQQKMREEIVKKSGLSSDMAGALWDNEAQSYLDKVGAFMLQQNKVAETQSKYAYQLSKQNDLAQTTVGQFQPLANYMAEMKAMYEPGSKELEGAILDGIDTTIDTWSAVAPNETVQWFNSNREGLRQVLGKDFADVNTAIGRVESRLLTNARRALANQQAAMLQQKRQQEALDTQVTNDIYGKIIDGQPIDISMVLKEAKSQGASPEALMTIERGYLQHVQRQVTMAEIPESQDLKAAEDIVQEQILDGADKATVLENINGMPISATNKAKLLVEAEKAYKNENGLNKLREEEAAKPMLDLVYTEISKGTSLEDVYDMIDYYNASIENKAAAKKHAQDLSKLEASAVKQEKESRDIQQEAIDNQWQNEVFNMYQNEDFNFNDSVSNAIALGVSMETVRSTASSLKTIGKPDSAAYSNLAVSASLGRIDLAAAQQIFSKGNITGEQYSKLIQMNNTVTSHIKGAIKEPYDRALDYIKNHVAPSGGLLAASDPRATNLYLGLTDALASALAQEETLAGKLKLLEFDTENSFINTLIKPFNVSPIDRASGVNMSAPLDIPPYTNPSTEGLKIQEEEPVRQRKPLEKPADFLKDIGG